MRIADREEVYNLAIRNIRDSVNAPAVDQVATPNAPVENAPAPTTTTTTTAPTAPTQGQIDMSKFNATGYLTANRDVVDEYNRLSKNNLKNNYGITTIEQFAARHYQDHGFSEGRSPDGSKASTTTTPAVTPPTTTPNANGQPTIDDYLKDKPTTANPVGTIIPGQVADTIADVQTQTTDFTKQLSDLTTSLTAQITQQQQDFSKVQTDLLAQMNAQAAAQSAASAKALADMQGSQSAATQARDVEYAKTIADRDALYTKTLAEQASAAQKAQADQATQSAAAIKALQDGQKAAADSVGQASKKPNYAATLKRNKELNSTGISSTMLTGPGGVSNSSLTLGLTSLVGA